MDIDPILSRSAEDRPELRQRIPASVLGVLDAVAGARDIPRHELVTAILTEWTRRQAHAAHRVIAILNGNPLPAESDGERVS